MKTRTRRAGTFRVEALESRDLPTNWLNALTPIGLFVHQKTPVEIAKSQGRIFRVQFVIAHFAAPWIGVLLGVGAYLLAKAGLLTIAGSATSAGSVHTPAENQSTLLALAAFIAGWNWTWLIGRLNLGRATASGESAGGVGGGSAA